MSRKSIYKPKKPFNGFHYQCPHCKRMIPIQETESATHCKYCGHAYPAHHRCTYCFCLVNSDNAFYHEDGTPVSCPIDRTPVRTFFNCPNSDCQAFFIVTEKQCPICKRPTNACKFCGAPNKSNATLCFDCGTSL